MMMRMEYNQDFRHEQRQITRLNLEQKLALKQLMSFRLELKHPEYPGAIRGLQGMQNANKILQEKESVGLLIGGLSEEVWGEGINIEDLYRHKDVDVLVLSPEAEIDKFEGGVDWWIPRTENITIRERGMIAGGIEKTWYENGNGIILHFGAKLKNSLIPGLYIPSSDWVVEMRTAEANANIDYNRISVSFDEDVIEKFKESFRKNMKKRIFKAIGKDFKGHILSEEYEDCAEKINAIDLEEFDIETLIGINNWNKNKG